MSRKKRNPFTFMIIVLIIAAIGVGAYIGINEFAVTSAPESGKYYEAPVFGYFACEEVPDRVTSPTKTFDDTYIVCQQTGTLTQDCNVIFEMPTKSEAEKAYSYLQVYIGNQDEGIPDGARYTDYYVKEAFFTTNYAGAELSITLEEDQFIKARYIETNIIGDIFSGVDTVDKGAYRIRYNPFAIYKYNTFSFANGQQVDGTTDCTFTRDLTTSNAIVDGITSDKLKDDYAEYAVGADSLRDPGRRVAFLSGFTTVPAAQYEFIGANKYCVDSRIYEVTEIDTTLGTYLVADVQVDNFVEQVECCNDADAIEARGLNYYCDENLEIQQYSEDDIACSAFNPCPMAGYVPGVNKEVYYQSCVAGVCVTDSLQVECISNADCPTGSYCDYDALNPENSECTETVLVDNCGNGVCEASFGETPTTCSKDCAPSKDGDFPAWALYSILGLAALSVIVAITMKKKNGSAGGQFNIR